MPLLDHFHPPLHGPRRWEGFHHSWATFIAQQLNEVLPQGYFAEPERPYLKDYGVRVYRNVDGVELLGAIELVGPVNKSTPGSRRLFSARCAGFSQHGIGLLLLDIVTTTSGNLHAELLNLIKSKGCSEKWESPTALYAVSYRAVTVRKNPRVEAWTEALALGETLPVMPLWLSLDLCVPVRLEESYLTTCRSLRISA